MITHTIMVEGRDQKGFFSLCKCALYGLRSIYTSCPEAKVGISIGSELYCLPGENLYEKYFTPVYEGAGGIMTASNDHPGLYFNFKLDARYVYTRYANGFFQPRDHLMSVINEVSKNLGPNPLGVHYRGTDHWDVATIFSYDMFCNQVKRFVDRWHPSSVFMASDVQEAVDAVRSEVPGLVCLDHLRVKGNVKDGIHRVKNDVTLIGNEAVVDSYILSRCAALISGESNLADWAIILSPEISHVKLL
jgi:hypothetical protein